MLSSPIFILELVSIGGAKPVGESVLFRGLPVCLLPKSSTHIYLVVCLFSRCPRAVTGGYLGSGPPSGEHSTWLSRFNHPTKSSVSPGHPDERRKQWTDEQTVDGTPVRERPLGGGSPETCAHGNDIRLLILFWEHYRMFLPR